MAAPTRAIFGKIVQIQAVFLQKPCTALLKHAPAVNAAMVRLKSNKANNGSPKTSTEKGKSASPPPQASDGTTYESQEYYEYNPMSFYDVEGAVLKYRQTQPDPSKPAPAQ